MNRNLKSLDSPSLAKASANLVTAWAPELLGLVLISFALVAQASTKISEEASAQADGHVLADNVSGSIRLTGWDKNQVKVRGELGDGAELLFQSEGDRTTIRVVKKDGVRRMKESHLVIDVPQGSDLTGSGVSADMEVTKVLGAQRLETVSGDINTESFGTELDLTTVSGDIRVEGERRATRIEVAGVSGDLTLQDVAGDVRAKTVSGDIELADGGLMSRIKVGSTSGDIELELGLEPRGRLQAETISGDVDIELTQTTDLDVDIESHSGRIESCLNREAQRKAKYGPGRFLRFTEGAGDRLVRIETLSGSVELCARSAR